MLLLALDSKKDSETIKLIAVITMFYLPATFIVVSYKPLLAVIIFEPVVIFIDSLQYGICQPGC